MNLKTRISYAALAAGIALGPALAVTASAQEAQPAVPAIEAPGFTEEKLRSFAVAYLQVDAINNNYLPQVEAAATPEEQQQLREEAAQQMVDAVEQSDGITPAEYGEIIQAAQSDAELAQQLSAIIAEEAQ